MTRIYATQSLSIFSTLVAITLSVIVGLVYRPAIAQDLAIRNVTVYDVEAAEIQVNQEILVSNGNIVAIQNQPQPPTPAQDVIDGSAMLALPGFVNTHTHLWQHIARSFEPAAILQDWIRIYRYAHYLTLDELDKVTYIAAKQAQLSGITTVSDFASVNFQSDATATTVQALKRANMGGHVVWWHPASFMPSSLRQQTIAELRNSAAPLDIIMGFGPLSFYSIPAVYDGIVVADALDMSMSEHTMENPEESRSYQSSVRGYLNQYGTQLRPSDRAVLGDVLEVPAPSDLDGVVKLRRFASQLISHDGIGGTLTPTEKVMLRDLEQDLPTMIPFLDHLNVLEGFLAIHSVWLNQIDFDTYVNRGTTVSHNPESNMYLSSGAAPIVDYQQNGVLISLGTDGAASNDRIDAFTAMRNMINLQKVTNMNATLSAEITPWEVLQTATINGAQAMGLESRTGSLAEGKEADIVLLNTNFISLAPYVDQDDVAIIINSASVRDVDTVISDGTIVVSGGRLIERNEAMLAQELDQIVTDVVARQQDGKTWSEDYVLSSLKQYASVRRADTVSLTVTNEENDPKTLMIAFSGDAFGGTTASMLSTTTLSRFPYTDNTGYAEYTFTLDPGRTVDVEKPAGEYVYNIVGPAGPISRIGRAEQILLLDTSLLATE